MHTSNLITAAEAARILAVSPRWVARLTRRGTLHSAHKLPGPTGAYLFERTAVEALKANRAGK